MTVNHLRSYALGIAAALVSLPMYASMQAQPQNLNLVSANAELTQALNSKSTHQGQSITAKLTSSVKTEGQTELPKGTVLMGKVAQVKNSTANGNQSKISIVFNEARLSNGREVPIKATLLAAYPPALIGVAESTSSYMIVQPHHIPNDQKVQQDPGTLNHVMMKSAVQSNVSGIFLSKKHDINLHRGTRLQLAIAPETSSVSTASGS
ncbi:MAG TPA: hypothetical protein VMF56_09570 [Acidobacteriaceae bacterium]|nr:hypothetical protein [Acidobacteriaceae bacterium]